MTTSIARYDVEKAKDDAYDLYADSPEEHYHTQLELCVMNELEQLVKTDFTERMLKKYFEGIEDTDGAFMQVGDDARLMFAPYCLVYAGSSFQSESLASKDAVGQKLSAAHIQPQTGWQLCTADWTTAAGSEEWGWLLILTLEADADAEAYTEKMQALYADYLSQVTQPNCSFIVNQYLADDKSEVLWSKTLLLGEKIDSAAGTTEDEKHSLFEAVSAALHEKYAE